MHLQVWPAKTQLKDKVDHLNIIMHLHMVEGLRHRQILHHFALWSTYGTTVINHVNWSLSITKAPQKSELIKKVIWSIINQWNWSCLMTCPAKANPSAISEEANQICKQIWNAAIGVGPSRAAIDADNVTQHVAAITLVSNRKPGVGKQSNVCNTNTSI
jgi:hypothetical protein